VPLCVCVCDNTAFYCKDAPTVGDELDEEKNSSSEDEERRQQSFPGTSPQQQGGDDVGGHLGGRR